MTFQEILTAVAELDDEQKDELISVLQDSKSNEMKSKPIEEHEPLKTVYESEEDLLAAIDDEIGKPGSSFRIALMMSQFIEGPEDWSENIDHYLYGHMVNDADS